MRARAQEWPDTVEGRVRALAAVPYLAGLGAGDLQALAAEARLVRAAKGAAIFHEGSPCAGLHVIAAGRVRLLKRSAEGREQDRKSTRLNSSHSAKSRMPSSA